MDKEQVYKNIFEMINDGFFARKYAELTKEINLPVASIDEYDEVMQRLENISANIFNAILIGCQLFDDKEKIVEFVDMFASYLTPYCLTNFLEQFNITEQEALERLKHGFGVHFTTPKICEEIQKTGSIAGFGKNAMFTEEEDLIINAASKEQKENDPYAEESMRYLFKGWGTGVSSYSSMTNGFWMYHTPESLSFLFGNISRRNKEETMKHVIECTSALTEENKRIVFETMSNIYDRLVGNEHSVGCVLIDRDAFEYEVDNFDNGSEVVSVERRPYMNGFNDLMSNDNKITKDIDISSLKFLKIPTIIELELQKREILQNENSKHNL